MKEYNICFASDDRFVPYMEALIVSILRNSLDDEKFIFHVITLYISDDNKLRLDYLKKIKRFDIYYYNAVNIDKYNKWFQEKTDRKWSVEIFFK